MEGAEGSPNALGIPRVPIFGVNLAPNSANLAPGSARLQVSARGRRAKADTSAQWGAKTCDLHRVLDVVRTLYLTLSQHDEAVMRVALELITDKKSKHIFKWHDDWYDDDDRRAWFGKAVKQQLAYVTDVRNGAISAKAGDDEDKVDSAALRAAVRRAETAEAALEAMRKELQTAKLLAADPAEAEKRALELDQKEEQIRNLQKKLKESNAALHDKDFECVSLGDKLQALIKSKEADDKLFQTKNDQMTTRISTLEAESASLRTLLQKSQEESVAHEAESAKNLREVLALRAEIDALKASQGQAEELKKQIEELNGQLKAQKAVAATAQAKFNDECEALRASTAKSNHRASALESEMQAMQTKLSTLEASCQTLQSEAAVHRQSIKELESRPPVIEAPVVEQSNKANQTDPAEEPKAAKRKLTAEEEEEEEKKRRESAKGAGGPSQAAFDEVQKNLKEVTAENKRLKVVIEEMQQKMKELMEACKKQGVDIDAIAKDLGLGPVLEVVSVWDRLYKDAERRIGRMEKRRADFVEKHQQDPYGGVDIMAELETSNTAEIIYEADHPSPVPNPPTLSAETHTLADLVAHKVLERMAAQPTLAEVVGQVTRELSANPGMLQNFRSNTELPPLRRDASPRPLRDVSPHTLRAMAAEDRQIVGESLHRDRYTGDRPHDRPQFHYPSPEPVKHASKTFGQLHTGSPSSRPGHNPALPPAGLHPKKHGSSHQLGSSQGFGSHTMRGSKSDTMRGSKSRMALPAGVHSHYVPRRKSRGKMGSSLGFSQGVHVIISQTKSGNHFTAATQPGMARSSSKKRLAADDSKPVVRQLINQTARDSGTPRRMSIQEKCMTLHKNQMSASMPSFGTENHDTE